MENDNNKKGEQSEPEKLFLDKLNSFKTLPRKEPQFDGDPVARRALFGILGGMSSYFVIHALPNVDISANRDEIAVLLTILAGFFIGGIHRNFRHLCAPSIEIRNNQRTNVFNGTIAGIATGVGAAALLPVIAIPTVPIAAVVAIVVAGGFAGSGAGFIFNRTLKTKYCPHCQSKGKCSQIVCRSCYRIFYPGKETLDCSQKPFLDWFDVASFLDSRRLNYLDAEELVIKYLREWKIQEASGEIFVECRSFKEWINDHEGEILRFIGRANREQGRSQIEEHLDRLDEKAMFERESSSHHRKLLREEY